MADDGYRLGAYIRSLLTGLLGAAPELPPPPPIITRALPAQFPPAGIDFITHELRIRLDADEAKFSEAIVMDAGMTIQRTDPYLNQDNRRQINFKVLSWTATGWIKALGVALTYTLSEDVEQPESSIIAHQSETDYPAAINFNVIFDARINNKKVFSRLHGRPEGHGFREIPPTGDRSTSPTITRFADLGRVEMAVPDLGRIIATPVDCNDQSGVTRLTIPGMRLVTLPSF